MKTQTNIEKEKQYQENFIKDIKLLLESHAFKETEALSYKLFNLTKKYPDHNIPTQTMNDFISITSPEYNEYEYVDGTSLQNSIIVAAVKKKHLSVVKLLLDNKLIPKDIINDHKHELISKSVNTFEIFKLIYNYMEQEKIIGDNFFIPNLLQDAIDAADLELVKYLETKKGYSIKNCSLKDISQEASTKSKIYKYIEVEKYIKTKLQWDDEINTIKKALKISNFEKIKEYFDSHPEQLNESDNSKMLDVLGSSETFEYTE
jgi:LPS O-antigen subunit length determinant protein (WzzB/FepE family)